MSAATRITWLAAPASPAVIDAPFARDDRGALATFDDATDATADAGLPAPTPAATAVAPPDEPPPAAEAGDDAPASARAHASDDRAAALATIGETIGRVGDRSATLVDGATTVLCLTSVMSTQLGEASTRADAVAAHAAEIAGRSREAAAATTEIRTLVDEARETVRALGQHARDIERISATLARLAMETRFVGLNAAIEAARAGAAGVGFAVVADKVRELADGAGTASEQIVTRLATIRDSAVRSAGVMEQVGTRIGAIDSHTTTIAAAAAEQETGAAEIAGGITQLATSVDDVVKAIEDMTEVGMGIGDDAGTARRAVDALHGAAAEAS